MSIAPAFCEQHGEVEPCSICKNEHQAIPLRRIVLISEREMVVAIRAALLAIVDALERQYDLKKHKVR